MEMFQSLNGDKNNIVGSARLRNTLKPGNLFKMGSYSVGGSLRNLHSRYEIYLLGYLMTHKAKWRMNRLLSIIEQ